MRPPRVVLLGRLMLGVLLLAAAAAVGPVWGLVSQQRLGGTSASNAPTVGYPRLLRFGFLKGGHWRLRVVASSAEDAGPLPAEVYWGLCTEAEYNELFFSSEASDSCGTWSERRSWCSVVVPLNYSGIVTATDGGGEAEALQPTPSSSPPPPPPPSAAGGSTTGLAGGANASLPPPVPAPLVAYPLAAPTYEGEIDERGMYYQALVNCRERELGDVSLQIELVNAGGEQLGFESIPLPSLFGVLTLGWSLLVLAWVWNWVANYRQAVLLHRIMTVFPVVKLIWVVLGVVYWRTMSEQGRVSRQMEYGFWGASLALRGTFFGILLLISSGWQLADPELGRRKVVIGATVAVLILTKVAAMLLHQLFLLLQFAIYVVIIIIIFRFVNRVLMELHMTADLFPREAVHWSPEQLLAHRAAHRQKTKLFRNFKLIMLQYIGFVMLFVLLDMLFLNQHEWAFELLNEILEFMVYASIAFTLRLRPFNLYFLEVARDTHHRPGAAIVSGRRATAASAPATALIDSSGEEAGVRAVPLFDLTSSDNDDDRGGGGGGGSGAGGAGGHARTASRSGSDASGADDNDTASPRARPASSSSSSSPSASSDSSSGSAESSASSSSSSETDADSRARRRRAHRR